MYWGGDNGTENGNYYNGISKPPSTLYAGCMHQGLQLPTRVLQEAAQTNLCLAFVSRRTSKKKLGTVKLDHLRLAPCFPGMFLTIHSSHQRRELPITGLRTRGALEISPVSSPTTVKISHIWISKYSQPKPKPPEPQKQAVVH